MDRRRFLQGSTATAIAVAFGQQFWTSAYASPAIPAPGPYGPLAATPDANGLFLPAGFTSRVVGVSGQAVSGSSYVWHVDPDGGATFAHTDGSWTYVSNSEDTPGGVGAITFAVDGTIIGARRILDGTRNNCAGGPTPWGTWMSCEETGGGWIFDCEPLGNPATAVRLDALGQRTHEAAAVDAVGRVIYTTEDDGASRFYRWVPNEWTGTRPNFAAGGQLQALQANLAAAPAGPTPITWVNVTDLTTGYRGADTAVFRRGEGCWIDGRTVYFCTTSDANVWAVDGAAQTIELVYIGGSGSLSQADNVTVHAPSKDLFVAEDSGNLELVIITSPYDNGHRAVTPFMRFATTPSSGSEVAGPAFSPDGTRLYVSSQRGTVSNPGGGGSGVTYEITGPFRTSPGGPGGPDPTTTTTTTVPPTTTTQPPADQTELVPYLSTWRILDDGSDRTPGFAAVGVDDSTWKTQTLQAGKVFGYGDSDSQGDISFGPDPNNKYRTTYFRHVFTVADPSSLSALTLTLVRDDGAVVYLNGAEVWRNNIPAGALTHLTFANDSGPERQEHVQVITNGLVAGPNTLAVELHQSSNSSSDLAMKIKLTGTTVPPAEIPEVSSPVLLAVGAAAVLGTAAVIHHVRTPAAD